MPDPIRDDEAASAAPPARESRIEDLLLAGLDHYFSGQPELAISVWTRVLFVDRGHARARAYIDRARGAIAERQREGEELLHTGAAAFDRGDTGAARALLTSAVDRGAGTDEAQALLARLDRLTAADAAAAPLRPAVVPRVRGVRPRAARTTSGWMIAAILSVGIVAGAALTWLVITRGLPWTALPSTAVGAVRPADEALPVPSRAEVALSRARAAAAKGRLHDALDALTTIPPGNPLKDDADSLRADIQRRLLDAAHPAR